MSCVCGCTHAHSTHAGRDTDSSLPYSLQSVSAAGAAQIWQGWWLGLEGRVTMTSFGRGCWGTGIRSYVCAAIPSFTKTLF